MARMSFQNREERRMIRLARSHALRVIRRTYFKMHDYLTPGRTIALADRIALENALYQSFFSSIAARRSQTDLRRDYRDACNAILTGMRRLHRSGSIYQITFDIDSMQSQLNIDDVHEWENRNNYSIVREGISGLTGNVSNRCEGGYAYTRPETGSDIHICSSFFYRNTNPWHRAKILIHEMCHSILHIGILRGTHTSYISEDFQSISIRESLLTPDKYAFFALQFSWRHIAR